MILTRTPYNAAARVVATATPYGADTVSLSDQPYVRDGYIRVFQDVRGKYGSEGQFVMTRPVRGPLNPTKTDETTDAWDTIDWLVKQSPKATAGSG